MKIGFIGLGLMGSRMALNLAANGFTLNVYNRTKSKAEPILSKKINWQASPAAVSVHSDIIITMLSTPEAVQEVALGENGLLSGMKQGNVWIDCSTVNPSFSKQMAEITESLGFNFLDSPVAGSLIPAEKGDLLLLVGGKKSIVKYCDPVLKAMGRKYIHVGESGKGAAMKLVNNLVMALSIYAFAEGMHLAESSGITKEAVFNLMEGSPIVSPMISSKKNKFLTGDYSTEFPLRWLQKDLHLAAITAYEQGVALPGANAIKEIFAQAKQAGLGDKDFTAIYSFIRG